MHTLTYNNPALFWLESQSESSVIDPARDETYIHAANVDYDGAILRFDLLITHCFADQFVRQFQRFSDALVFMLEDADQARAEVGNTVDPHKRYPPMQGPNFKGGSLNMATSNIFITGWIGIPFEIELPIPEFDPSFFVTVYLLHQKSNTLCFDLTKGNLFGTASDGEEWDQDQDYDGDDDDDLQEDMELQDVEDQIEEPLKKDGKQDKTSVGIVLDTPSKIQIKTGDPITIEARLQIKKEELILGGVEKWMRSLNICIIHKDTQMPICINLLGDRIVFAKDMHSITEEDQEFAVAPLNFELQKLIGHKLDPGVYYVFLSARQYKSEALEILCE